MFCCYRGTKMEIQGLTDTLNTQRQHGVLLQRAFSPQGTVSVIHASSRLDERENSDHSGSLGVESVDDNSRARSSPLGPVEHGSRCFLSVSDTGVIKDNDHPELSNVTVEKQKQVIEINLLSSGLEGADEHEHSDMREVALPFVHTERNAADQGFANNATSPEQLYVVFNVVHKDNDSKERPSFQSKAEENGSSDTLSSTRESDENISSTSSKSTHLSSHSSTERTDMTKCFRHDICLETEIGDPMLTENYLGSRYMPKVSTANTTSDQLISLQQATDDLTHCLTKNSPAFVPENRVASEMSIKDYTGQESAPDETPVSVHETFSGTIMINNQSIIVTIENGILTLAAPPEGCAYKEDGVISLKEHLGMKDNEDLVLLNYDGGSKSIGKISNFTTSSQDEPKASLVCSDSELTLADGCSLPKMDVTLNSCPSIKQEEGVICTVDAANNVCQNSKSKPATFEDDLQPINHFEVTGLTKKGSVVKYRCPQLGCSSTFDTRQNLKIHLVVHSEDQRPFKCTVEGCGWSFTTSYKLKRHLQSHDKVRPYKCEWENCGRHFTTVYNLKAHVKAHDQENAFVCEVCNERFRTATRLANHQRSHFEPERPHKCEFPGCEKTFITFSALFSHNRTHFRELGQFTCTYPGCDKRYDKACRLKIHLRSHTGERPFICDSDSCGWTFTSMSKLLRHKRKHDDDRRFTCPEEGCGKSFTRAEHLKGHSITHLGTKPFECHVEGCNAKFSARSSLYIHSKKHRQDGVSLRSRCPVAGCTKHFSSRSSVKTHMLKHHNLSPDVLSQLESTPSLTPSSELTSSSQMVTGAPGPTGTELGSLDLSSLFSSVPTCPGSAAVSVGPIGTSGSASFSMDMSLVNTGILTIDPASVGSTLNGAKTIDPLILATGQDIGVHVLDTGLGTGGGGGGVLSQATLHLDDVQTVNPEELGTLTALAIQSTASSDQLHSLSSSNTLTVESPSTFTPSLSSSLTPSALPSSLIPSLPSSLSSSMVHTGTSIPKLLTLQTKAELAGSEATMGPLLSSVEVRAQTNGSKGLCQYVFHSHSGSYNGQKNTELPSVTTCPTMESSGSARTDYRAIQLAKRRKQKCPESSCVSETGQTKSKGSRDTSSTLPGASSAHFGEGTATGNGDLPIRDPVTGAQFVQIQLLQDDPAAVGDLAFQLSSQSSCSHSQLTVDLPVNILQEPTTITEDENGSDNSQFTGSTINLQDLE